MATYKELVKAYEAAGRPSDSDAVRQLLIDAGLTHEQAISAFEAAGQYLAPQETQEPSIEPEPQQDDLNDIEIPVGYTITSKTGKEFVWKGAQWTSKGQIVGKAYKDKVTMAAKQKIKHDQELARRDAENAEIESTRMKDADHEFENIPSGSEESNEQHQVEQEPTQNSHLQDLAQQIKASPDRDKLIKSVMSTGTQPSDDRVAQLAASIKANGQERQARAELGRYTDR